MGYATIMRVPRVDNHRHAKQLHDISKPIRGRLPEVRPLGDRRDVDKYHIRKNGEAIELVLYKTPVITFTPEEEVVVFTDGYDTVSTHQFIARILGIPASGLRGKTVLAINGVKVVLSNGEKLRLKRGGDGNWHPLNPTTQYGWKLDRKAITNVRNIYVDFYKYLKGFVNLRTEKAKVSYYSPAKDCIVVPLEEFKNTCGGLLHIREYCYMDKRGAQHINYSPVKVEQYRESATKFEHLIRPDQPEDVKHTNFYKAALLLVAKAESDRMDMRADETIVQAKHIVPKLDEILFQFYAHDVLVREVMPQGKVSSGKYDKWMVEW
jgi:hypothetical protein